MDGSLQRFLRLGHLDHMLFVFAKEVVVRKGVGSVCRIHKPHADATDFAHKNCFVFLLGTV